MAKSSKGYKKHETTRRDRMHNIATAILEIHKSGKEGTRTRTLREHIRRNIALPELDGEERNGDLRAHGDALGGHGLHLDVGRQSIQGKSERVVMFTDKNIQICKNYLENAKDEEECSIF